MEYDDHAEARNTAPKHRPLAVIGLEYICYFSNRYIELRASSTTTLLSTRLHDRSRTVIFDRWWSVMQRGGHRLAVPPKQR
jgi:hypothetical protein